MNNDYKQMGIYELRNFARDMGVKSPTVNKKKAQLIEEINLIMNKVIKPHKSTDKRGRPPKTPVNFASETNIETIARKKKKIIQNYLKDLIENHKKNTEIILNIKNLID